MESVTGGSKKTVGPVGWRPPSLLRLAQRVGVVHVTASDGCVGVGFYRRARGPERTVRRAWAPRDSAESGGGSNVRKRTEEPTPAPKSPNAFAVSPVSFRSRSALHA